MEASKNSSPILRHKPHHETKAQPSAGVAKVSSHRKVRFTGYDEKLCSHSFTLADDGSIYYDPRQTQQFVLACSTQRKDTRLRQSSGRGFMLTAQPRPESRVLPSLAATGTALEFRRRQRSRNFSMRMAAQQPCKRFSDRWRRATAMALMASRSLRPIVARREEGCEAKDNGKELALPQSVKEDAYNSSQANLYSSQAKYQLYIRSKRNRSRLAISSECATYSASPLLPTNKSVSFPASKTLQRKIEVGELKGLIGFRSPDEALCEVERKVQYEAAQAASAERERLRKPAMRPLLPQERYHAFYERAEMHFSGVKAHVPVHSPSLRLPKRGRTAKAHVLHSGTSEAPAEKKIEIEENDENTKTMGPQFKIGTEGLPQQLVWSNF